MKVFWKSIKDNRRGYLGWALALTAVAAMYSSFWPTIGKNPEMTKALDGYPQGLKEAFHLQDLSQPENYLSSSVFGLLVPILLAVFAIAAGTKAIAGDEEAGTLDLVLAHPVSRARLALQRLLAVGAALLFITGLMWLAVSGLRGPSQFTEVSVDKILAVCLQLALFGLFFAALTYAIGAWTGRKAAAMGTGAAVAVLGYLADSFLPQINGLKWTEKVSPFEWYLGNDPLRNGISGTSVLIFAALSAVLIGLGTWRFSQRDIAV
jgi:ABC-2 type transport system permease protein